MALWWEQESEGHPHSTEGCLTSRWRGADVKAHGGRDEEWPSWLGGRWGEQKMALSFPAWLSR